ncbi:hypothetical protein HYY70_07055 [Candidatus Woesearchaeota archaeon]|nr:hypothetical protein [Candidatus Woesearchaeota archaeon]
MPDATFLYFSFIAGLVAFFAPCSFAILPGYVTYYISKYSKEDKEKRLIRNTILAYILGMSIVMIAITTLTFATKYLILKKLDSILPLIKKLSAVVLVFAGIYMIYYQYSFFV